MDAFCLCLFLHVWSGETLNTPNLSSMADEAIAWSGIGVLASPFYICDWDSLFTYEVSHVEFEITYI